MKLLQRCLQTFLPLWCFLFIIFGCSLVHTSVQRTSSLVEYLYPKSERMEIKLVEEIAPPALEMPIELGLAFVPESKSEAKREGFGSQTVPVFSEPLSEKTKMELIQNISQQIQDHDLIKKPYPFPPRIFQRGEVSQI